MTRNTGFVSAGIVAFILGIGSRCSGDARSKDLTAKVMAHSGGRWLVIGRRRERHLHRSDGGWCFRDGVERGGQRGGGWSQ